MILYQYILSLLNDIISNLCNVIVVQSHTPTLYVFVWRVSVCPELNVTNGTISPSGPHQVGSTANVTCDDGFRIALSNNNSYISKQIRCQEDSNWNDSVSCELKGTLFALVCAHWYVYIYIFLFRKQLYLLQCAPKWKYLVKWYWCIWDLR